MQGLPSDDSDKGTTVEEEMREQPGQHTGMFTIGFGCLLGLLAFAGTVAMYRMAKAKPAEIDMSRASAVPSQSFVQLSQEKTTAIERAL